MFRLYDTRTGQAEWVESARPGQLSTYVAGPMAAGRSQLGGLRAAVVSDVIRRVAERHRLLVTAWQLLPGGAAGSAQVLRAAWDDLNIYPLEFTQSPPDPVDVSIAAEPGGDAGHAAPWVRPGVTWFTAEAAEIGGTPGTSDAAGAPATTLGTSRSAKTSATPSSPPETSTTQASPTPSNAPGTSTTAQASPAPGRPPQTHATAPADATRGSPPEASTTAEASVTTAELTARGLDPLALRFAFLTQHYRAPMALAWEILAATDQELHRWRKLVADWASSPSQPMNAEYLRDVLAAFDDDLDTPAALDTLRKLIADSDVAQGSKFETFAYLDRLLGLDLAREIGR